MLEIYESESEEDRTHVRELFREYLQWANSRLNEEYGINFEIEALLEQDMLELDKFMPPHGCLLLAKFDNNVAGLACMRKIRDDIAELKWMYVRAKFRKQGVGRNLLDQILNEAEKADTQEFAWTAHVL